MLRPVLLLLVLLTQTLSGCASTIKTLDGTRLQVGSSQFRDHVFDVFKRHNNTLTVLFDMLEQVNDADALRLDRAEQRMIEACEKLNSAAAAQRDGKIPSAGVLLTISSTIRECDQATFEADQLIREINSRPIQDSGDQLTSAHPETGA